nr:PREDICTED: polycystic kidney disease and receptor for egg jelly-related protein isoform X5 [Lepisosteus oculatus]
MKPHPEEWPAKAEEVIDEWTKTGIHLQRFSLFFPYAIVKTGCADEDGEVHSRADTDVFVTCRRRQSTQIRFSSCKNIKADALQPPTCDWRDHAAGLIHRTDRWSGTLTLAPDIQKM